MLGNNSQLYQIHTRVTTEYVKEQSKPESERYVFAYHITLENTGTVAVRLISRHWLITDGNQQVHEVSGKGVVGQQPHLAPGQKYAYSSGCMLETPVGSMRGSYQMQADDGHAFDLSMSIFTLSVPGILH
ncbi:MAG: Co2+/Mg2+ efflux protein ApaG [Endozoicomonadaceae bacterium]|nr:Co2+/Mg2+ efflux protein ApaG [Endozoicomonadaceae bacterium]